jgi:hypothetical protein
MQALMIYTSKCNNLNTLRHDVLFILRLINVLFIFITQLLVGPILVPRASRGPGTEDGVGPSPRKKLFR